jgi:hypothetical protein
MVQLSDQDKQRILELAAAGYIANEIANTLVGGKLKTKEYQFGLQLLKMGAKAGLTGLSRVPGTALGVARGGAGIARLVYMRHPLAVVGTGLVVAAYEREKIADLLRQGYEISTEAGVGPPREFGQIRPGPMIATIPTKQLKRAVSKANRAVKQGMKILKEGTKVQTGSKPGTLPKQAFKMAVKAAGMANPKTPTVIGKGKSKVKALARKLKKWW